MDNLDLKSQNKNHATSIDSHHNQFVINLTAIKENLKLITEKLPSKTRVMVMIKAQAYGTDDVRMAQFLENEGIDILGVAYVDEGVNLRKLGITQSIFVLHAAPFEVAKAVTWEMELGISTIEMIDQLAQEGYKQNKIIKVHLHINTGMGRFGCRPEESLILAEKIQGERFLQLEGVMTHFACADDPEEDLFTLNQAACFDAVIEEIRAANISFQWIHAANSSAAIRFHFPHYNMVRLGLSIYGLYTSSEVKKHLNLRSALSFSSRIVSISDCKKGETISYGRQYKISKETQKIAVLPIGYFDGFHRCYSDKAHVMIQGKTAPMVGAICMDYMMIDITDIPNVAVGDKVLMYGEDESGHYLCPEALAGKGNSIVYELMTSMGPRIPRIFLNKEIK